jgi:hypothetical protein
MKFRWGGLLLEGWGLQGCGGSERRGALHFNPTKGVFTTVIEIYAELAFPSSLRGSIAPAPSYTALDGFPMKHRREIGHYFESVAN